MLEDAISVRTYFLEFCGINIEEGKYLNITFNDKKHLMDFKIENGLVLILHFFVV